MLYRIMALVAFIVSIASHITGSAEWGRHFCIVGLLCFSIAEQTTRSN